MSSGTAYQRVVSALTAKTGYSPPSESGQWKCPAHPDKSPSLSVTPVDGKVLVNCHAGCSFEEVVQGLNLHPSDFRDDEVPRATRSAVTGRYRYLDERGELLFTVERKEPGKDGRKKDFEQVPADGRRGRGAMSGVRLVPYRLPEVIGAVAEGRTIFCVEGEKCADAMVAAGEVATCNPRGAEKWRDEYSTYFKGADVVLVADKDAAGRRHVDKVKSALMGAEVGRVVIVEAQEGCHDAYDHLHAGFTVDEFVVLDDGNALAEGISGPAPLQAESPAPVDDVTDDDDVALVGSSWAPVDLVLALSGAQEVPPPSMLTRTDGEALIYAGRIHGLQAEPELGKSWAACVAGAQILNSATGNVFYIDFEDNAQGIGGRLLALGVPMEVLTSERFSYFHPGELFGDEAQATFDALLAERKPDLAIIDGITEVMVDNQLNPEDNADVQKFIALLPRRIQRAGAAVLLLDHVIKDKERRGRYAIGGQHKLAAIDGASYILEAVEPLGRGREGRVRITVAKDKNGWVRRNALHGKTIGELVVDANADGTVVKAYIAPPDGMTATGEWRPTELMERISHYIEDGKPSMPTTRQILDGVTGGRSELKAALAFLIKDGYVSAADHGNSKNHALIKPFRTQLELVS